MPSSVPTESGPPPLASVAMRISRPRAMKTSGEGADGALIDPLGGGHESILGGGDAPTHPRTTSLCGGRVRLGRTGHDHATYPRPLHFFPASAPVRLSPSVGPAKPTVGPVSPTLSRSEGNNFVDATLT